MTDFPPFTGQVTLRQRHQLPDSPGIYFIVDERDRLLYIGQAKNLRLRWVGTSHHRYKQFSRKGLDKLILGYILNPISELNELEKEYIKRFKPLLNDSRVKASLPKLSPRFSELQRLLKLANQPLFPSVEYKYKEGKTIPRENWDLFRGFVAGVYLARQPHIIVICRQNMGEILWKSSSHRNKKRFYLEVENKYTQSYHSFDARQAIIVFLELYDCDLADRVFQSVYPHLIENQLAGVMIKKILDPALLSSILQVTSISQGNSTAQDYILRIWNNLQPLTDSFSLDSQIIW